MRAIEISTPGHYRYRRDSDQPWKFAQVSMYGGIGEAPDFFEFAVVDEKPPAWHSCTPETKGEFHGPVDPDPEKAADKLEQIQNLAEDALVEILGGRDCLILMRQIVALCK